MLLGTSHHQSQTPHSARVDHV